MTPPLTNPVGPGGQQDQGHRVVLHDQGEIYQQPIFFMSESSTYECRGGVLFVLTPVLKH